jgi:sugar O-acyltransferase (sialic acid O-acetyltransferase NeuD family)
MPESASQRRMGALSTCPIPARWSCEAKGNFRLGVRSLSIRGIVIGGGAFGREILNWLWDCEARGTDVDYSFYLDTDSNSFGDYPDFPLTNLGDPETFVPQTGDLFLIAIGNPAAKNKVVARLDELGATFASLIHPTAVIARTAIIGRGVTVGPNSYVATHAQLGDFSCINSLSGIGHDAVLGRSCTVSSQVDITGGVALGNRVFVGSGARILPNVQVGEDAKIGAGSIVVRDIKSGGSVFSQPARKI